MKNWLEQRQTIRDIANEASGHAVAYIHLALGHDDAGKAQEYQILAREQFHIMTLADAVNDREYERLGHGKASDYGINRAQGIQWFNDLFDDAS